MKHIELRDFSEEQIEILNSLIRFKGDKSQLVSVFPYSIKALPISMYGSEKYLERMRKMTLENGLFKTLEQHDPKYIRYTPGRHIELLEPAKEVFRMGGFGVLKQRQIEQHARQMKVEQAAIDAPVIAKNANMIAIIAVIFTALGILFTIWLHFHPYVPPEKETTVKQLPSVPSPAAPAVCMMRVWPIVKH